ncbi:MAG: ABC transporter permease [Clostridiales bacterium]|jgi:tungstate transport system permease protein|nr:ABC transporter permease [Clostridiales bacterium]
MTYFVDAFKEALGLLLSFDKELYGIILLTLRISAVSLVIGSFIGIPIASILYMKKFPGKGILLNIISTFMGLPPVVVGLFVYIMLSNQMGLLGHLKLLFTPVAMIIAQTILALPIVIGLTYTALMSLDDLLVKTSISMGASEYQLFVTILKEARYGIGTAVITAFGRLMAEVGAVMMVGGNVRYQTRVMTTAIALHKGMGEFQTALALGTILLFLSFIINYFLQFLKGRRV